MNGVSTEEHDIPTDAALVYEVLEGDTEAFGELVTRYRNLVASFIAARVAYGEVDDLGQETFLRAFGVVAPHRAPPSPQPPGTAPDRKRPRDTKPHYPQDNLTLFPHRPEIKQPLTPYGLRTQ